MHIDQKQPQIRFALNTARNYHLIQSILNHSEGNYRNLNHLIEGLLLTKFLHLFEEVAEKKAHYDILAEFAQQQSSISISDIRLQDVQKHNKLVALGYDDFIKSLEL